MSKQKFYITFGQIHIHKVNGKVLDKDCVAVFNGELYQIVHLFGDKYANVYTEDEWKEDKLQYYPRGYIEIT